MNQYQFEQVCRRMEKRYGKIRKGEESRHEEGLRAIETNLLTVRRQNRACDSRRVLEAVPLALYAAESRLTGQEYDLSAFENPENLKLKHAILMAFDPFTNAELRKEAEEEYGWNLDDGAELEAYYQRPVQCVLRILDSAKKWIKERGNDGYFNFISAFILPDIEEDGEMDYAVPVKMTGNAD